MSNKSRRRLTMAAGALLAGAAIPIAAAGAAWAEGDASTTPSDTKTVIYFSGTTYDEFVTTDGKTTETVKDGADSNLGLTSASGYEDTNDKTASSGTQTITEVVDFRGVNTDGGNVTEIGFTHDVIPAAPPA